MAFSMATTPVVMSSDQYKPPSMADVMAAARAKSYTIARQDSLPDGEFEVLEATFAEVV